MSCDLLALATPGVAGIQPYQPGKPMSELERELGIENIIKLASNENAFGPSPGVAAALTEGLELERYPDGNGFALKQALAEFHHIPMEQITLGNGSNDIIDLIARAVVPAGHQVVFSEYAFAIYPIVTRAIGAAGVVVPALDWGHDLPAMAAAVTGDTRLIFIANPNNPTGTWSSAADLESFLRDLPDNIIVLVDQAYFEYVSVPGYPDCIPWVGQFPNLVVTRTFSKVYGLAALRVGYAVSHPDVADLMNRVRAPFNVNSIALHAARLALDDQEHVSRTARVNSAGMQQMVAGLDSMGIHAIPSVANFICIDLQQAAAEIYEKLLHEGVIVRPIAGYGMPNHLRVTIGLPEENNQFLKALARVLGA